MSLMKWLLAVLALAAMAISPPALAGEKPLVMQSAKIKQLPSATTLQLQAPTTANATVNLPHGTAPSSPANGDCWTTTAGLFCHINSLTVGPFGTGGGGGGTFRGALVTKAANQTGANFTGGVALTWDSEAYDTDSIHDTVTNNPRLTVPSGVSYVRIIGAIQVDNVAAGNNVTGLVTKNGSSSFAGRGHGRYFRVQHNDRPAQHCDGAARCFGGRLF